MMTSSCVELERQRKLQLSSVLLATFTTYVGNIAMQTYFYYPGAATVPKATILANY